MICVFDISLKAGCRAIFFQIHSAYVFIVSFRLTKAKIEKIFDLIVIKKSISETDKTLKNDEPINNDLVNIN